MARNERITQETPRREGREDDERRGRGASLAGRPMRGDVVPRGVSPFSIFERMFSDMDRLFDEFRGGPSYGSLARLGSFGGLGEWAPQLEVFEREGKLVVRADLPGVKQEDLQVRLEDDSLIVSGERRSDREEKGEGYWRSERSYGRFERVIPLPENVDEGAIDARFEDGVLEISLALPAEKSRGREIPIAARAGEKVEKAEKGEKGEKAEKKIEPKKDLS